MLISSRQPGSIHVSYSTCKPVHGVIGFMMSCAAAVILLQVLLRLFQVEKISEQTLWKAGGLSLFACLLFFWGTTWFFSFITGYSRKLAISDGGIRYGLAFFAWPQVREIGARMKRECFQVHIELKRGLFTHRWLLSDDGMSREMAEDFTVALRRQILPHYPQLEITRLPELPPAAAAEEPAGITDAETSSELP